jgi:hypothetical protein
MWRVLILCVAVLTLLFPVAAFPQARSFLRGFTEQFTSSASNWGISTGRWSYGGGVLTGLPAANNTWTSLYFWPTRYSALDYTVKMKRTGCNTCSLGIIVRGGGPLDAAGDWANGMHFVYTNGGYFTIYKTVNGRSTILRYWSHSGGIINNGWNMIRVTAVRNTYRMYINNVFVAQFIDFSRVNGYVGIKMFAPTIRGNSVIVDWAILNTTVW